LPRIDLKSSIRRGHSRSNGSRELVNHIHWNRNAGVCLASHSAEEGWSERKRFLQCPLAVQDQPSRRVATQEQYAAFRFPVMDGSSHLAAAVGARMPAADAAFEINARQLDEGAEQDFSAVILQWKKRAHLGSNGNGRT